MTNIDSSGFKMGQILVDKETGRTKATQEVQGIDLGVYFKSLKDAKMVKIDQQKDIIDINNKKLLALIEFKNKAIGLNKAVSALSNRLNPKEQINNVMVEKQVTLSSTSPKPSESLVQIDYFNEAKVGSFNMKVNQVAVADSRQSPLSLPDLYTPLGLDGSFRVGTIDQASMATVTITAEMTASQIIQAINAVSGQTHVTADLSLISPTDPTKYHLCLSTKQLSTPLVLQDVTGNILTNWNMILGKKNTIESDCSGVTNTPEVSLGLTGNLVIRGPTLTSINTSGLSLQQMIDQVNGGTATSGVCASLLPLYGVNALSADKPIGYGIQFSSLSGDPVDISGSDLSVINGLHLKGAVTSCLHSALSVSNPQNDQGITGNLILQASGCSPCTIQTDGKRLNDLVAEINASTSTSGVFAKLQMMIPETLTGGDALYQLTLATSNGQGLIFQNSDAGVINGLGMDKPVRDYQSTLSKLTVNGTEYQRFTNTVDDIIPGLTFHLKSADPSCSLHGQVQESKEGTIAALDSVINAYNDLHKFYTQQTAMKEDFSSPIDGALLHDDYYIKGFMGTLQQTFCGFVGGTESQDLKGIRSIGLRLSNKGELILEDEKKWNTILHNQYPQLTALFENTVKNTNAHFKITEAPPLIDPRIDGKEMKISLKNDAILGTVATIEVEGQEYSARISMVQQTISITPQDETSPIGKFKFSYRGGIPPIGQSVTTTCQIIQGLMAKVDGFLLMETDPDKVQDPHASPPFDIKGKMMQNIAVLQSKNTKITSDIEKNKQMIDKEIELIERRFDGVLAAKSKYQMIQGLLKGFMKANTH